MIPTVVEHPLSCKSQGRRTERGLCDICECGKCRHAHTSHRYAFAETTLLCQIIFHCVVGVSFACHREKRTPHFDYPSFKGARGRNLAELCRAVCVQPQRDLLERDLWMSRQTLRIVLAFGELWFDLCKRSHRITANNRCNLLYRDSHMRSKLLPRKSGRRQFLEFSGLRLPIHFQHWTS